MKISLHKLSYFVIGSLILIPLNFFVLGAQVFYVQTLLVIFSLIFLVSYNQKIKLNIGRSSLTLDVLIYLGWVLFSFLVNFIFSLDDIETQGRRFISVGIALLLISGFFVGRSLPGVTINTKSLINGIFFAYLLVMLYIAFIFLIQPTLDLYIVKNIIGQRLPFVIAFVSSLAAVYLFLGHPKRFYDFIIMISGIFAVVFSLTRAAYIQIFISFFFLFAKEIRKYFFRGVIIAILFVSTAFILLRIYGDYPPVKQMTARVELLFDVKAQSTEDVSGSYRLLMWKFLMQKLLNDPIRLVIGYGQLGPTHIAKDFVLPDGTSGDFNAHSQYLDIVVREGIIGLFLFLWLCYKSLILGLFIKGVPNEERLFIFANSIGLIGVLFYGVFHETFRYPLFGFYFWIYLGIQSRILDDYGHKEKY